MESKVDIKNTYTDISHISLILLLKRLGVLKQGKYAFRYDFGFYGTRYEEVEPPSLTVLFSETESNSIY
jgi:hypothetical protein